MDSSAYRELPQQEPWVPYEKRAAAWFIWNELYQVTIPYIQMLSMEELQEYGMPYTGSQEHDRGTANEMRLIMIPISEMIIYYNKGVQVHIVNKEDTKKMYERISDHLNDWKHNLEKSLNIGSAPLEDLKLMDRFANAVYEHAKYQFTDDTIASFLAKRIDTRHADLKSMIDSLENPMTKEQKEEKDLDERYPKRESLSDFFQPYRGNKKKSHVNQNRGMNSSKTSVGDFIGGVPQYGK
jgi:hypothetical protein